MNWLFPQTTLQIEPTRRCNLNCKICMRRDLNETTASLSLKDFGKVLDSSDLRHVALHGWGEPLLNPELFQMVKYAESQGVSTELTTNATLLQRNIGTIFASGLSSIAFGIHNKENLPVVIPPIRKLIAQRNSEKLKKPTVYIDIVIYRENQYEIARLIEIAAELSIDAVVLHRVFNVNKVGTGVGYISIQEEKELFVKIRRLARELNVKLYLPPRPSIPCRAVKHSIFVTSKRKVTPCPYLPEFYMGDALNEGLKEVIYSQRYRTFVRNMKKHPICNRCPLGSMNGSFYS